MGDNGYFARRIKYVKLRKANRQRELNESMAINNMSINNNNDNDSTISLEQQRDDFEFLKYCIVGDVGEHILIEKLNSTRVTKLCLMNIATFVRIFHSFSQNQNWYRYFISKKIS